MRGRLVFRNKHVGDGDGRHDAVLGVCVWQQAMSHPVSLVGSTHSPPSHSPPGRNLGKGLGACHCLVLKTNWGRVIHKSTAPRDTFDQSECTKLSLENTRNGSKVRISVCTVLFYSETFFLLFQREAKAMRCLLLTRAGAPPPPHWAFTCHLY